MSNPVVALDGLIALANSVRAYFAANNIPAEVPKVGLKSRSLWARSRVVFVPGEFDGNLDAKPLREGRLTAPDHTKSDNPRELVTWERVATVCVLGVDPTRRDDEEAQIQAATRLLELTLQAMWNATTPIPSAPAGSREFGWTGQASLLFDNGTVTGCYPPVEMGFGRELLLTFTQRGPLFDAPIPTVTPTKILNFAHIYSSPVGD
jgi:hypothetical protein